MESGEQTGFDFTTVNILKHFTFDVKIEIEFALLLFT